MKRTDDVFVVVDRMNIFRKSFCELGGVRYLIVPSRFQPPTERASHRLGDRLCNVVFFQLLRQSSY